MPSISRFLGVTIWMYHNDHAPPHFHATYGGAEAVIGIEPLAVLNGELPPRVLGLLLGWADEHRDELKTNWHLAEAGLPPKSIVPPR